MNKYAQLNFTGPEPSELFLDSIQNGFGASEATCDFCGKTHLAVLAMCDAEDDINDNWRNYCEEMKKDDPEHVVVHHDCYAMHTVDLDGKSYVNGCDCNKIRRYESWIWENRAMIRRYLRDRCIIEKQWADEEHLMNVMSGIAEK